MTYQIISFVFLFGHVYNPVFKALIKIGCFRSDITQELEEPDERRDRAFNGIFKYVDAFANHFEEEKSDAAAQLYDAILLLILIAYSPLAINGGKINNTRVLSRFRPG